MTNGLFLDFVLLHYLIRDKKFALEISKDLGVEFFDSKVQVFYGTLMKHFMDPDIREVLSLTALIDYSKDGDLKNQSDRFAAIYNKAKNLTIDDGEIPESDFKYYLKRIKSRRNIQIIQERFGEEGKAGLTSAFLERIGAGGTQNTTATVYVNNPLSPVDKESLFREFELALKQKSYVKQGLD